MKARPLTPELVSARFAELQQLSRLGASLLEAELPPSDRGVLEHRSARVVGRSLARGADPRDVRFYVLASAVDRHLGWMPDAWVDPASGAVMGHGLAVLVAAFVRERPVDALPRGCDGTITLRFLSTRPSCVDALPILDHSDHKPRLWLCSDRDRQRTRW